MLKKRIKIAVVCSMMLLVLGCKDNTDLYIATQDENLIEAFPEQEEPRDEPEEPVQTQQMIYVQVCGAVKNPGIYCLPEGSRMFEVIQLAGGLTEEADFKATNQAGILSDGQMVYVYALGEKGPDTGDLGPNYASDGKVNINTADIQLLMTLPGIGESKARQIIDFREKNGVFSKIEDLMEISGIKEGVFSKIKDYIKV